jgi:NAD(P)-dependent dehydrogenase (short-subunit alcohol dehydrogenase family)
MSQVIVTGAEQGIGLELARQYADSGERVIAACLNPRTDEILELAASAPGLEVFPLDVTSDGSVAAFSDRLSGCPVDLLINNAGIHRRKWSVPESVVFADWEDTFRVNTIGVARISFAVRQNLARAGQSKLVTISSDWGSVSRHPGTAYDYCSSKAAVNSLMRGLALNWKDQGTTVLMIHPGWTRTSMGGEAAPLPAS